MKPRSSLDDIELDNIFPANQFQFNLKKNFSILVKCLKQIETLKFVIDRHQNKINKLFEFQLRFSEYQLKEQKLLEKIESYQHKFNNLEQMGMVTQDMLVETKKKIEKNYQSIACNYDRILKNEENIAELRQSKNQFEANFQKSQIKFGELKSQIDRNRKNLFSTKQIMEQNTLKFNEQMVKQSQNINKVKSKVFSLQNQSNGIKIRLDLLEGCNRTPENRTNGQQTFQKVMESLSNMQKSFISKQQFNQIIQQLQKKLENQNLIIQKNQKKIYHLENQLQNKKNQNPQSQYITYVPYHSNEKYNNQNNNIIVHQPIQFDQKALYNHIQQIQTKIKKRIQSIEKLSDLMLRQFAFHREISGTKQDVKKVQNQNKIQLNSFEKQLKMVKQLFEFRNDLVNIEIRITNCQQKNQNNQKKIRKNVKQIDNFKKTLQQLNMSKIKSQLLQLTEAVRDKFLQYNQQLSQKITNHQLQISEQSLFKKIDQIASLILYKFADKAQTKRALVFLQNRINQLLTIFSQRNQQKYGLFSKKTFSCASCDSKVNDVKYTCDSLNFKQSYKNKYEIHLKNLIKKSESCLQIPKIILNKQRK